MINVQLLQTLVWFLPQTHILRCCCKTIQVEVSDNKGENSVIINKVLFVHDTTKQLNQARNFGKFIRY